MVVNAENVTVALERMIERRDMFRAILDGEVASDTFSPIEAMAELSSLEPRIDAFATYWSLDYDA